MKEKKLSNKNRENLYLLRFSLFIINILIMMSVTIIVLRPALIILNTQYKLFSIYINIEKLESKREYYQNQARIAATGDIKRNFQRMANEADAEIPKHEITRQLIMHSNNYLVYFSAQNGVSLLMILLGFIPIILLGIVWTLLIYKYHYARLIKYEASICIKINKKVSLFFPRFSKC